MFTTVHVGDAAILVLILREIKECVVVVPTISGLLREYHHNIVLFGYDVLTCNSKSIISTSPHYRGVSLVLGPQYFMSCKPEISEVFVCDIQKP